MSSIGKRLPPVLHLHADAIGRLRPILRLVDGVARGLIGSLSEATVVKLHLDRPAVSYLEYFDRNRAADASSRSPARRSVGLYERPSTVAPWRDERRCSRGAMRHAGHRLVRAE